MSAIGGKVFVPGRCKRRVLGIAMVAVMACLSVLYTAGRARAVEPKPLTIEKFTMQMVDAEQTPYAFTQAGGHPWGLATTIKFATEESREQNASKIYPTRDPKDIVVSPPAGLFGNPNPKEFPQCPLAVIVRHEHCPSDTQVGVERLGWYGGEQSIAPIVNLTPEKGQSAEFGLETHATSITQMLTAHVIHVAQPPGSDAPSYGLTLVAKDIPNAIQLRETETVFWGVPADPSHDNMRGHECSQLSACESEPPRSSGLTPVPFLTMPTNCSAGPLTATLRVDSWEEPGSVREGRYEGYKEATAALPGVTGCGQLSFAPTLEVAPDTLLADTPVEETVNVNVPLVESTEAPATPQLRDASVTLPAGLSVNPGVVNGVEACEESGPEGINFEGARSEEENPFSKELQLAPGHCPDASTIGEVEAVTPLQSEPLKGFVYLARPGCGNAALGQRECTEQDAADGNLYQLYMEIGGTGALADTGVNIKVRLKNEVDPATGQITTITEDSPQFPFSHLAIRIYGGQRGALSNPASCGDAVTSANLTPWSAPGTTPEGLFVAGTPSAAPSTSYEVTGCSRPTPFNPGFAAGTVIPNAGKFSSFTMNLTRQDREQFVKGIQIHTPPGLLGMLSNVPLCEEPLADTGHCPESSKIGTTRVASGAGSEPFEIDGDVYLTGPQNAAGTGCTVGTAGCAPFGLSIVTHAVAGPFNLGLVVVRARIDVDPENSTLTVTTDETGPYAVPQIIFGVPLRLKRITVNIDRPGFMFNPTDCETQKITATISGSQDAVANVSSPFAVGECRALKFEPKVTASVSGKVTIQNGTSLKLEVTKPALQGEQADLKRFKIELPAQLPSRLTTLQKACTAAQFDANPAGCPAASDIGYMKALTPLLPVPVQGPMYFVSRGGEAWPSLKIVLQGDGVTVILTAQTLIRDGVTSSTLSTLPDVPFSSAEVELHDGRYSALTGLGNLCAPTKTVTIRRRVKLERRGRAVYGTKSVRKVEPTSLVMPTEMVAQNGAVLKQSTKIAVAGCPAAKAKASRHRTRRSTHSNQSSARSGK